ncbi:MAG: hypothetical protein IKH35_06370 [Prevotella sp.]|nr:hypothetical protein [Prevotella sp.]
MKNKAWLFGKKGLAKDLASIIDNELCLALGGVVEETADIINKQLNYLKNNELQHL